MCVSRTLPVFVVIPYHGVEAHRRHAFELTLKIWGHSTDFTQINHEISGATPFLC